jgi:hypothetical protein
MQRGILFCLLLSCLFVFGCTPLSEFPLSQPGEYEPDQRLVGIWLFKADEKESYFHFSKERNGWSDMVVVSYDRQGKVSYAIFNVFTTPIQSQRYMNINIVNLGMASMEDVPSYILAKYEIIENDKLYIQLLSPDEVAQSIGDGVLQGEIKDIKDNEIYITDSSENLIKFIESSDMDKLFSQTPYDEKQWGGPYQKIIQPFADSPAESLP